jgi:hypothetical protein
VRQAKELGVQKVWQFLIKRGGIRPDPRSRSNVGFAERRVGRWDAKGGSVFSKEDIGGGGVVTEGWMGWKDGLDGP